MSAGKAARIGLAAMRRGDRSRVAGLGNRMLVLGIRLLPRRVLADLAYLVQTGRKR
jgi:hypothetical protein